MKPSRRKTLDLKTGACQYCDNADKTKLRQKRDYCSRADIHKGHCLNFKTKQLKVAGGKKGRKGEANTSPLEGGNLEQRRTKLEKGYNAEGRVQVASTPTL